MGSLSKEVSAIFTDREQVTIRPAAAYGAIANTIFTITGGPVWLVALFGHVITAIAGVPTMTFTVAGASADSGATIVTSGANTVIVCPLDDSGLVAVVPNLARTNLPGIDRMLAVTGNIVVTVGAAPTVGTVTWYCVWRAINPVSMVNVA